MWSGKKVDGDRGGIVKRIVFEGEVKGVVRGRGLGM